MQNKLRKRSSSTPFPIFIAFLEFLKKEKEEKLNNPGD
jgi:hypothetical protein